MNMFENLSRLTLLRHISKKRKMLITNVSCFVFSVWVTGKIYHKESEFSTRTRWRSLMQILGSVISSGRSITSTNEYIAQEKHKKVIFYWSVL